jgi:hypothetical protein
LVSDATTVEDAATMIQRHLEDQMANALTEKQVIQMFAAIDESRRKR